eukprot:CAMPEP_0172550302 /NCGR_PEP_ID=MMETSP1067-20121228/28097_1 /TAXON_ID=265564 ORGANISM="Thalassiosira punctigera, Strain Tpunct2005C2" /NCGR_SAMPLE_ID=MMETSP1067 /ASSEMBLY_ACC=CAM_ASM_000444 /LENGTH=74 /DNA_ID=CAMNT_0013337833 /DNA_START=228 /DNA_END=450 /DNA_ORIENTATION=-
MKIVNELFSRVSKSSSDDSPSALSGGVLVSSAGSAAGALVVAEEAVGGVRGVMVGAEILRVEDGEKANNRARLR